MYILSKIYFLNSAEDKTKIKQEKKEIKVMFLDKILHSSGLGRDVHICDLVAADT